MEVQFLPPQHPRRSASFGGVEWILVVAVAIVVYTAIFFLIRANVRRLMAMRPAERSDAARRQLIFTAVAAGALMVIALLLLSD